jgi:hypothetical protein
MKRLNWKNDADGKSMTAWASRAVGGRYRVSRREDSDGVWFEVEHRIDLCASGSERHRGCWEITPVQQQPVARTWSEAIAAAEADNHQRIAVKDHQRRATRGAA